MPSPTLGAAVLLLLVTVDSCSPSLAATSLRGLEGSRALSANSSCVDCRGQSCDGNASLIGDSVCHDGTDTFDFNCAAHTFDAFDCEGYRLPDCDASYSAGDGVVGCFQDNSNRIFPVIISEYETELTLEWCAGERTHRQRFVRPQIDSTCR